MICFFPFRNNLKEANAVGKQLKRELGNAVVILFYFIEPVKEQSSVLNYSDMSRLVGISYIYDMMPDILKSKHSFY